MTAILGVQILCFLVAFPTFVWIFYRDDKTLTLGTLLLAFFLSLFNVISVLFAVVIAILVWADDVVLFKKKE